MPRLIQHVFLNLVWVSLIFVLSPHAFCYQKASSDPNRNMNSSYYTSGNPYYNSLQNGQHWLFAQCTWYVWGRCAEIGWNISGNTGFAGNAKDFYNSVQGASGKDQNPQVGDIMCLSQLSGDGHVAIVVQVNNANSWVIDEYNINDGAPTNPQWSRETVTRDPTDSSKVTGELFGTTYLQGFIHGPGGGGRFDPTNPYVDAGNNGTQSGTALYPFKTVTQAVNAASSTQAVTMHIKPGTYHESVTIHKNIHIVTWESGTVSIGG